MNSGLVALLAALVAGTAIGLIWRATNGRMRRTRPIPGANVAGPPAGPAATGPQAGSSASAAPAGAPLTGAALASTGPAGTAPDSTVSASTVPASTVPASTVPASTVPASTVPASTVPASTVPASTGPVIGAAELGEPLGERATLVQFSSAFCAPCRATRRILTEVAGMVDGVSHVEIDAESRLDLVRAHGVLRTPTVFVLAADGAIIRRASGQPRKADVIAALGEAVPAAPGGQGAQGSGERAGGGEPGAAGTSPVNSYSSGLESR